MIDNFMDFFIFAKISRSEKQCADYGRLFYSQIYNIN